MLAATNEKDVDVRHGVGGAPAQLDEPRFMPMPLRPPQQREDVAAVAIDVHEIRVEPTDRQLHVSQYGCAHPRLTSSALRSSIAVYGQRRNAGWPSFVDLISCA